MKTLIFNGSPKKNGDTDALISELASHLSGEVKIISCYDDIKPCNDCRYCWEHIGCDIDDEMQDVYRFLESCDTIVLASPIWFSSLSGPLLNLVSRIQCIWAANFFQKKAILTKKKSGALILVGAEPKTVDMPEKIAMCMMKHMSVDRSSIARIYSLNTNAVPAGKDEAALHQCREVAKNLNQWRAQ